MHLQRKNIVISGHNVMMTSIIYLWIFVEETAIMKQYKRGKQGSLRGGFTAEGPCCFMCFPVRFFNCSEF